MLFLYIYIYIFLIRKYIDQNWNLLILASKPRYRTYQLEAVESGLLEFIPCLGHTKYYLGLVLLV